MAAVEASIVCFKHFSSGSGNGQLLPVLPTTSFVEVFRLLQDARCRSTCQFEDVMVEGSREAVTSLSSRLQVVEDGLSSREILPMAKV